LPVIPGARNEKGLANEAEDCHMNQPPGARVRVLLINSRVIPRAALRALIETRSGLVVVGEAGVGDEAVDLARQETPDIIILDLDGDANEALRLVPELLAASDRSRVLALTNEADSELVHRAVDHGVIGLVLKQQSPQTLFKAIERIALGEAWLDRSVTAGLLVRLSRAARENRLEAAPLEALTKREREVVALVASGLRNRQIAARLYISDATVRNHLSSIFGKLGMSDRRELMIHAYRHGLATPPR
jgi:DNA-binding NarL/FixJ family response regulator